MESLSFTQGSIIVAFSIALKMDTDEVIFLDLWVNDVDEGNFAIDGFTIDSDSLIIGNGITLHIMCNFSFMCNIIYSELHLAK